MGDNCVREEEKEHKILPYRFGEIESPTVTGFYPKPRPHY